MNLFSQDLKRLVSYSLRAYRLNAKNTEFARSVDYSFFRFIVSLLLKLLFKTDENLLRQIYFANIVPNRKAILLSNIIGFLVFRSQKEDLLLKKSTSMLKFFLRLFCLMFYQIPLYNHLANELKFNLFSILKSRPYVSILGSENKNVTSNFISRFLARKLAQRYR